LNARLRLHHVAARLILKLALLTVLAKMAKIAVGGWKRMSRTQPHRIASVQRRRREPTQSVAISATEAKNEFGRILETVIQGGKVVITRHNSPKAVLISMDEFNALSNAHRVELEALSEEFDGLLARMQTPAARSSMNAAFHATPKELGKAAVAAARRRV
jgi:antitoxin Phd